MLRWIIKGSATRPKGAPKVSPLDDLGRPVCQAPLAWLLVDDNAVNRKLGMRMLHHMGYRADAAANGIEALAALNRTRYQVVLMAIQMTEMDGLETTRRIRSEFSPDNQPTIIAMTANASKTDRARYFLAGMDDFVSKPLRMEDLAAILTEHEGVARLASEVETSADPDDGESPRYEEPVVITPSPSATSPSPAPVYDSEVLAALAAELGDDGVGVRADLIEAYLEDSTSELEALSAAREDASGEILRYIAHTLKSASAVLGLMALSTTAATIESTLRTSPQDVDVAFDATQLIIEYKRATETLRAALQDLGQTIEPSTLAS